MTVRAATSDDVDLLAKVAANDGYPWKRVLTPEYFLSRMSKRERFFILDWNLYTVGGRVNTIGYISLTNVITKEPSNIMFLDSEEVANFPKASKIHYLSVDESYQEQGFGKQLVEHMLEQARLKRKKYLYVFTPQKNRNAIGFYLHLDFLIQGTYPNKYGPKDHGILLSKAI